MNYGIYLAAGWADQLNETSSQATERHNLGGTAYQQRFPERAERFSMQRYGLRNLVRTHLSGIDLGTFGRVFVWSIVENSTNYLYRSYETRTPPTDCRTCVTSAAPSVCLFHTGKESSLANSKRLSILPPASRQIPCTHRFQKFFVDLFGGFRGYLDIANQLWKLASWTLDIAVLWRFQFHYFLQHLLLQIQHGRWFFVLQTLSTNCWRLC